MSPHSVVSGEKSKKGEVMRKVHYKVVLDVLVTESDNANGVATLEGMHFWPEHTLVEGSDLVDIQDVEVESVEVTDSR